MLTLSAIQQHMVHTEHHMVQTEHHKVHTEYHKVHTDQYMLHTELPQSSGNVFRHQVQAIFFHEKHDFLQLSTSSGGWQVF